MLPESSALDPLKSPSHIIKADRNQAALLGEILGDAFENDPVMNWGMPDPSMYANFFQALASDLFLAHEHCYLDSQNRGAALWLPPNVTFKVKMSLPQILLYLRLIFKKGPGVVKRLTHLQKVMDEQHPKIPHYYLQALGARQEYQGLGIGSALIKQVTRLCDAENTPAYLESSSVKNLPLYERHGFETFAEHSFDDEGTTLWFMLREPQTANS